ncbi:MAG TPA: sulfurtransferase TusA family protein [Acidobacteria bacterium]|nr:sulfurtransferase TusA family protein [Acidobacteriota bacterium]
MPQPPQHLDVLGLFCPVPILLAAREMQKLRPGDLLEIVGDDPGIHEDLPAWCDHAGHRLVEMVEEAGGTIRGLVEKGPGRRKG